MSLFEHMRWTVQILYEAMVPEGSTQPRPVSVFDTLVGQTEQCLQVLLRTESGGGWRLPADLTLIPVPPPTLMVQSTRGQDGTCDKGGQLTVLTCA